MATTKTLRVCLSSELPVPAQRNKNYLYFAYDKLFLYAGQERIMSNFAIVTTMPAIGDQIPGMIYIKNTDGSVHRKVDYADVVIANIESSSQIALLQKAGTMYYINDDHRYIDSQNRSLTLPWSDGTYELNVSTRKYMAYTKDTILKFNPTTNRFEVYGPSSEEFVDFSKPFRGAKTDSMEIRVDGPKIYGDARISDAYDNILTKRHDGLYVRSEGYMKKDEFTEFATIFNEFSYNVIDSLQSLRGQVDSILELITPQYIHNEIMTELERRYPTINEALARYDEFVTALNSLENYIISYMENTSNTTISNITREFEANSSWVDLDNSANNYTPEVDYYSRARAITNSQYMTSQSNLNSILLQSALMSYLIAEEEGI